ncbi:MAG: hypothetical protein AB1778_10320 [Candidatus Bipolaricaulota bacterium]
MSRSYRIWMVLLACLTVTSVSVAALVDTCTIIGSASPPLHEAQFHDTLAILLSSDAEVLGRSGLLPSGLFRIETQQVNNVAAVVVLAPSGIWGLLVHLGQIEIGVTGDQLCPLSNFAAIKADLATFLVVAGIADQNRETVNQEYVRSLAWPSGRDSAGRRVTITSPSRATQWTAGTGVRYTWETECMTSGLSEMFTAEYSVDGGVRWTEFAGVSNDGDAPWDIPASIDSDRCMLRLTSDNYPEVFDTSDVFAIRPWRSITITVPAAGTVWPAGSTRRYHWETTDSIAWGRSEFFTVEYSVDGGQTWIAFAGVSNDYSDPWDIPEEIDSDNCLLRMTSRNYPAVSSTSALFAIRPMPSISITVPSIYTSWTAGTMQTITWSSLNAGTPFSIECSTDGGTSWTVLYNNTANAGMQDWPIPSDIDSDECMIRLTSMQYPTVTTTSDTFEIHPEPAGTIAITAPTGSTSWTAGTTQTITWSSQNAGTPFRVEYSINGGSTWTVFSSSTGNDGTEHWPIPSDIDSDECRIRLTSMQYPTVTTTSATFEIHPAVSRSISITVPTGSASWTAGTTQTITWSSQNAGTPFRVEYSINGGSTWTVFSSSTGNDGTEHWPIPSDIDSDACKIRLTSMQYPTVTTTSDTFEIHPVE